MDFDELEDLEVNRGQEDADAELDRIAALFGAKRPPPADPRKLSEALAEAAEAGGSEADTAAALVQSGATLDGLAGIVVEERKERRRLERRLEALAGAMEELISRQEQAPDVWALGKRRPAIHPDAWVAPGAAIIGTVILHKRSSIWFNCTLRGDNELITIGENTDVQDNSILHCDPGKPINIGRNCLVGHQVCLHGCTIGESCLIGMRTTMLDNSKVGDNCFVAAGSFIGENKVFGDNCLIGGNPAKKIKDLSPLDPQDAAMLFTCKNAFKSYVENQARFRTDLRSFAP